VDRSQMNKELVKYLCEEVLEPGISIDPDTPLLSSGLMDSYALNRVIQRIEAITSRKIALSKVSPADFDSVTQMLDTAERVGTPA
jgi:hypothetical protein